MNPEEMWAYAVEKGYDKKTSVKGKTPWSTLGAQIYTNIQKHEDSEFVKVSTHPQKFGLKGYTYSQTEPKTSAAQKTTSKVMERDLHPLLVSFVNSDTHFHAQTMTIYQEHSTKAGKNAEQWMHPDLVSVHMPFDDLNPGIITLANHAGINTVIMFSFELKKEITGGNVRQYYFQAVSNSSWLMSPACRPVWSSFATSSLHSSTVFISSLRRSRTCVGERSERKPHPFLFRSKNAFISVGLFLGRSMDKSSS